MYNVQNEEEKYVEKWIHLHDDSIVDFFSSMNQSSRTQQQQGAIHLAAPCCRQVLDKCREKFHIHSDSYNFDARKG